MLERRPSIFGETPKNQDFPHFSGSFSPIRYKQRAYRFEEVDEAEFRSNRRNNIESGPFNYCTLDSQPCVLAVFSVLSHVSLERQSSAALALA